MSSDLALYPLTRKGCSEIILTRVCPLNALKLSLLE